MLPHHVLVIVKKVFKMNGLMDMVNVIVVRADLVQVDTQDVILY